jgi:Protein of unknown function (DUF2628)
MASKFIQYIHPQRGIVRVKVGFSWPAFWLGTFWAAAKRMWYPVFLLLVPVDLLVWFVSGYAQGQKSPGLALAAPALLLLYMLVRGHFGNRWVTSHLVRNGYSLRELGNSHRRVHVEPTL